MPRPFGKLSRLWTKRRRTKTLKETLKDTLEKTLKDTLEETPKDTLNYSHTYEPMTEI